jgi:hypothetical protein
MDVLQELILALSKEEVRHYKLVSGRIERKKRIDHELFDEIRSRGEQFDEQTFRGKYYGHANVNAYYRLKNRLLHDLFSVQWLHYLKFGATQQALTWYGLARVFRVKNRLRVSQYLLSRAESLALSAEEYELLDLILGERIRAAHESSQSINPEELIARRQANAQRILLFRDLDETLARARYLIQISQNFDRTQSEAGAQMLARLIKQIENVPAAHRTRRTRLELYQAVARLMLQSRDYRALEEFSQQSYAEFESANWFDRDSHEDKLRILVFLVNACFKNGAYDRSLAWADRLAQALEEYQRLHYNRFWVFYANALVINYAQLDPDRALRLLEEMKDHPLLRRMPLYEVFFYTNRALLWYRKGNFHRSLQELHRFSMHERFNSLADGLKLRTALFELMIRIEDGDYETAALRQGQIKRDFSTELQLASKESAMFRIVSDLIRKPNRQSESIRRRIQDFCIQYRDDIDDEFIPYIEWLHNRLPWLRRVSS